MTGLDDSQPIYLQLRQRVISRILTGDLKAGDALPSVRQVAGTERVNPLTVSKAYQLLVDEGLIHKRRGLGMFVSDGAPQAALNAERERFLNEEWPRVAERIGQLGLDPQTLLKRDRR
ncbi:MAG: GntR family transcriptional regulator [Pseudomonadota bacterium]